MRASILFGSAVLSLALSTVAAPTPPVAEPVAEPVVEKDYQVDPVHSSVLFRIKHLDVAYFYGCFKEFSGAFTLDEDHPEGSSAYLEIKAESVDSRDAKRDQHLKSPDFFNARQFPVIRFESSSVEKKGKLWTLEGDLTMRGTTREVTIPMTETGSGPDPWGGERIGFEGEVTIQRSEFGIDYAKDALGDEVKLIISLESKLKQD